MVCRDVHGIVGHLSKQSFTLQLQNAQGITVQPAQSQLVPQLANDGSYIISYTLDQVTSPCAFLHVKHERYISTPGGVMLLYSHMQPMLL